MDGRLLDPESLAFLGIGCAIAAAILGAFTLMLVIANRLDGRTRVKFRDEPPFRKGDGE